MVSSAHESSTQMSSQSNELFLKSSLMWQINRPTDHATSSVTIGCTYVRSTTMRHNNTNDMLMVLSWRGQSKSSPGSFDECTLSARWPPTLKPSQLTSYRPQYSIVIYYYYSSQKLTSTHFAIHRRVEGWVDLGTAVKACSLCQRLYIAVAVMKNTNARCQIQTWVLSHHSQACYH